MTKLKSLFKKNRIKEIVSYPNKIIAWLKENPFEIPILEELENKDYIIKKSPDGEKL
jgi:hypothetical protein